MQEEYGTTEQVLKLVSERRYAKGYVQAAPGKAGEAVRHRRGEKEFLVPSLKMPGICLYSKNIDIYI